MPARATLRLWLGCSLLLWAARLALAWAASRPLAYVVGVGDGDDRLLFEPGALFVLEVLRLRADLLAPALASTLLLLLCSWVLLLGVTSAILAWLTRLDGAPAWQLPALDPWKSLRRIAALASAAGAAAVALAALVLSLVTAANAALQGAVGPTRDVVLIGALVVSLPLFAALGALFDLARVHVLAGGHDAVGALRRAWETFTAQLQQLVVARAAIAAASLLVIAGAGALAGAQPLAAPERARRGAGVPTLGAAGFLRPPLQVAWFVVLVKSARPPQA